MKHLEVLKNLIKNDSVLLLKLEFGGVFSVPDPDLAIRGGGGLQTSVWSKNTQRKTPLCKEGNELKLNPQPRLHLWEMNAFNFAAPLSH